jgi:ADP-ribosylglycohydrolase
MHPPPPAARAALLGLAVGDALGETFFSLNDALDRMRTRTLVPGPWRWTDDTAMALAIVEVLEARGTIDTDHLARVFGRNYLADSRRGYGGTAHEILGLIGVGAAWKQVAAEAFEGQGSMGNGAAMRVAPLGAWFADDLSRVRTEALLSAAPTHAHPDGAAGAVAVAVATAVSCRGGTPDDVWRAVLDLTPPGDTRDGLVRARALAPDCSLALAAATLGTGWKVTSSDTVPFVIWCATRHLDDYEEAFWLTVQGLGDRDTTCAMVGGIIGARVGVDGIPAEWRARTEPTSA